MTDKWKVIEFIERLVRSDHAQYHHSGDWSHCEAYPCTELRDISRSFREGWLLDTNGKS